MRYFLRIAYGVIVLVSAMEFNFLGLFGYSPGADAIREPVQHFASELYTADGVLIARYFREDRTPVTYEQLSPAIIQALISTEDIRFYRHHGVDLQAVLAGILSTAQGDRRGGSTITQQLAKNLYRFRFDQSVGWLGRVPGIRLGISKIKEWVTAFKLESNYTKEEILTMYLNTVSFGNNAYGIGSAAKRYFSKSPDQLDAPESALLVGLLKGTSLYNPLRNPEQATARRNTVLGQMYKAGFLDSVEWAAARQSDLQLRPGDAGLNANHDSYLRVTAERWLEPWCEENGYDLYSDGLKIYTTIDSRMQAHAEASMQEQMKILQQRLDQSWGTELPWRDSKGQVIPEFLEQLARETPEYKRLIKDFDGNEDSVFFYLHQPRSMEVFTWDGPKTVRYSTMDSLAHFVRMLNVGMMAMDPWNGAIKVWVGGIDYRYYKYDHVWQSRRQAGSTFKTFAYLAALESGMDPCDRYVDRPVRIDYIENGLPKSWAPRNADWVFTGREMSLRWAMGKSVNSITAQITEKVGWDKVAEAARRCGIESPLAQVPSISLGSSDVTVFEMVNAYATFVAQGQRVEPRLIARVEHHNGKIIYRSRPVREQVLDPEIAWLMTYMLRGGVEEPEGTSQGLWAWDLWREGNQIGGKTGTSSDYVDGWYMGMTGELVTGIWIGCDDRSIRFRNSQTGEASRTALPLFGRFMEKLYRDSALHYTYGPLPPPQVKITRNYHCPSPRVAVPDSTSSDPILLPPPVQLLQPNADFELTMDSI